MQAFLEMRDERQWWGRYNHEVRHGQPGVVGDFEGGGHPEPLPAALPPPGGARGEEEAGGKAQVGVSSPEFGVSLEGSAALEPHSREGGHGAGQGGGAGEGDERDLETTVPARRYNTPNDEEEEEDDFSLGRPSFAATISGSHAWGKRLSPGRTESPTQSPSPPGKADIARQKRRERIAQEGHG